MRYKKTIEENEMRREERRQEEAKRKEMRRGGRQTKGVFRQRNSNSDSRRRGK